MPALSWRLGVRIPPSRARPPAAAIESCTLDTARLLAMLSRHSQPLARCASVSARTHAHAATCDLPRTERSHVHTAS